MHALLITNATVIMLKSAMQNHNAWVSALLPVSRIPEAPPALTLCYKGEASVQPLFMKIGLSFDVANFKSSLGSFRTELKLSGTLSVANW